MKSSSVQLFILELLQGEHAHYSAQEIFNHIKPRLPSVNPSTVYRALDRMVQNGEVSISDMGTGTMVYDLVGAKPHHHLVCQECKRVLTLEMEYVQPFFDRIESDFQYQLTTNHLILFGICPACLKEKNIPSGDTKN